MRNAESVPLTVGSAKAPAVVLPSTAPPSHTCAVPVQKGAQKSTRQTQTTRVLRCRTGMAATATG